MDIAHLHFLVAEADPAQRLALVDMLGSLGASQVTEVPDGHTALRCFQDSFTPTVNVAIIDLALPGMDGLELIRTLAAMNCRARLIVVGAQPNNLMFSVETMAQAYGFDLLGAISKPVSAARLAIAAGKLRAAGAAARRRRRARASPFPKSASACRRASSSRSSSRRSNSKPARSRGSKRSRAGAIRSTACWGRPRSSTRSNRTTASTSSTGA